MCRRRLPQQQRRRRSGNLKAIAPLSGSQRVLDQRTHGLQIEHDTGRRSARDDIVVAQRSVRRAIRIAQNDRGIRTHLLTCGMIHKSRVRQRIDDRERLTVRTRDATIRIVPSHIAPKLRVGPLAVEEPNTPYPVPVELVNTGEAIATARIQRAQQSEESVGTQRLDAPLSQMGVRHSRSIRTPPRTQLGHECRLARLTGKVEDQRMIRHIVECCVAVVREIGQSPYDLLRRTAAEALFLCHGHSAGVSRLASPDDVLISREAIVGPWARYAGTTGERHTCFESGAIFTGAARLLRRPVSSDPSLLAYAPGATEVLVAPLGNQATVRELVWVALHDESHHFNAGDVAQLSNFGQLCGEALSASLALPVPTTPGTTSGGPASSHTRALSRRERQVCLLVARGHTNSAIAALLHIGEKSVETYRARIRDKLGFSSRADFLEYALAAGWLERAAGSTTAR